MCTCPVPAETRERAGLVFGQVPADLHVPEVAGLQRRRLGDPGRTMGRGTGWGLELGSAVRTEQRVAVAPSGTMLGVVHFLRSFFKVREIVPGT